jgi:hypothetical protein
VRRAVRARSASHLSASVRARRLIPWSVEEIGSITRSGSVPAGSSPRAIARSTAATIGCSIRPRTRRTRASNSESATKAARVLRPCRRTCRGFPRHCSSQRPERPRTPPARAVRGP